MAVDKIKDNEETRKIDSLILKNMKKIAIPVTKENQLEDHFGQCEFYGIYTISDTNEILNAQSLE